MSQGLSVESIITSTPSSSKQWEPSATSASVLPSCHWLPAFSRSSRRRDSSASIAAAASAAASSRFSRCDFSSRPPPNP